MNADELVALIKKHGLKPATKRELSLFTLSLVAHGYCVLHKKLMGFTYEALGAWGNVQFWHSMINEPRIAELTEKFIDKEKGNVHLVLDRAHALWAETMRQINAAGNEPERFLMALVDFYSQYFAAVGVYNCFWRYIGDKTQTKLSPQTVKRVQEEREEIAKFYPIIEKQMVSAMERLGKELQVDGELLRFMTLGEMKEFLSKKSIAQDLQQDLAERKKEYVYLFVDGKEQVFTQKDIIAKVKNEFFTVLSDVSELRGTSAYQGVVKGVVFTPDTVKPPKDGVLVTHMTKPGDIALIKNALAIVTDEGGILCHAAVIARELNKPCVIGTKIATKVLKDGDIVEVDADKGVVRKVK